MIIHEQRQSRIVGWYLIVGNRIVGKALTMHRGSLKSKILALFIAINRPLSSLGAPFYFHLKDQHLHRLCRSYTKYIWAQQLHTIYRSVQYYGVLQFRCQVLLPLGCQLKYNILKMYGFSLMDIFIRHFSITMRINNECKTKL